MTQTMQSISVIIPFRASDEFRMANLLGVVRHIRNLLPNAQIQIAEQDDTSKLSGHSGLESCDLLFDQDDCPFNKSKMVNRAAEKSRNDILFVCDADVLVRENDLHTSVRVLSTEYDFARPYQQWIDLDVAQSKEYLNSGYLPETHKQGESSDRAHLGEKLCLAGGAFVVTKKAFHDVAGFDERFSGWGGEDNAFVLALQTNSKNIGVMRNGKVWHLWHPRAKLEGNGGYHGSNLQLLNELYAQANGSANKEP